MTRPHDLRPTVTGRLVRRGLRALATPAGRVVLTLLAIAALAAILGGLL